MVRCWTGTIEFESFGNEGSTLMGCPAKSFPKQSPTIFGRRMPPVMKTEPYWISGPWTGRLAIAPRPRGHDWLEDELRHWNRSGVDVVVSLLTDAEIESLGLTDEGRLSRDAGMEFGHFPIEDRAIPLDENRASEWIRQIETRLRSGRSVLVHCRQGIGRASMIAIATLVLAGVNVNSAVSSVERARGRSVPETAEQLHWLHEYAESVAPAAAK